MSRYFYLLFLILLIDFSSEMEASWRQKSEVSKTNSSISIETKGFTIDNSGNFWIYLCDRMDNRSFNFRLKKYNSSKIFVDSVKFPDMADWGFDALALDVFGNAWVEGTQTKNSGSLAWSVFYKVNSGCNTILDSTYLQSSYKLWDFGGGIASDAVGNIWSAGVAVMDTSEANLSFQLALWKFNNQGQIQSGYPKYYARGFNGDGGYRTIVDKNGNIYSCGFSANGTSTLDVALWKFDATGSLVPGFPKFVPNVIDNLDKIDMDIAIFGNNIWIATNKMNFGVRDLALINYDLDGNYLGTKYWHTSTRTDVNISEIEIAQNGMMWIRGDTSSARGQERPALWLYDATGNLVSGFPQTINFDRIALDPNGYLWLSGGGIFTQFLGGSQIAGGVGPTTPTTTMSGRTQKMAFDNSGNLWILLYDRNQSGNSSNFRVKKLNKNFNVLDSVSLPPSILEGTQSITFDPVGNAWISALFGDDSKSPNNWYFSIYKVNSSGNQIIDSVSYQSSYKFMDFAAGIVSDATGNIWSTGFIMTDTTNIEVAPKFQQALWKYTNSADLVGGYPKIYQRGYYGDGSFATAIDASGNVYGLGLSKNALGKYDLALWKFDANGTLVGGFPKFVADWTTRIEVPIGCLIYHNNALWTVNQKTNAGVDDFVLMKFDLDGSLLLKKFWHTQNRNDVRASGIAIDNNGIIYAIGEISDYRALWKYDPTGQLIPGFPKVFDGSGFALDGNGNIWTLSNGVLCANIIGTSIPGGEGTSTLTIPFNESPRSMAFDNSGNLWMLLVRQSQNDIAHSRLAKYSPTLSFIDSVRIPAVTDWGWIGFTTDIFGNGWTCGLRASENVTPEYLFSVVYKVNPGCNTILDSAILESSYRIMDFALRITSDANGSIWATGLRCFDTTGFETDYPRIEHSLWKLNNSGQLAPGFPKIYRRGYLTDGSLSVAIDRFGSVFSVGISRNAQGTFDIAIWKYDNTGELFNGFPKFIPNMLTTLGEPSLPCVIQGDALWIATQQMNAGIYYLILIKCDLNGNLLYSKSWRPYRLAQVNCYDMAIDQDNFIWVVGDTSSIANRNSRRVVWRYNTQGQLSLGFPKLYDGSGFAIDALGNTWTVQNGVLGGYSGGSTVGGIESPVSVDQQKNSIPESFSLYQNYPNPFNPTTAISYQLSANSHIQLKIFDLLGREVATLVDETKEAGSYTIQWNASGVPSGIYFCRMQAGQFVKTIRLVLVK